MNKNKFSVAELDEIDKANDLHIAPYRADGKTYGTPTWIWEVVVDGRLFVRAYNGRNSSWYQSAIGQQAGKIVAAGVTRQVAFDAVEGDINSKIDQAYRAKYSSSPYLDSMIGARAKNATIEISLQEKEQ